MKQFLRRILSLTIALLFLGQVSSILLVYVHAAPAPTTTGCTPSPAIGTGGTATTCPGADTGCVTGVSENNTGASAANTCSECSSTLGDQAGITTACSELNQSYDRDAYDTPYYQPNLCGDSSSSGLTGANPSGNQNPEIAFHYFRDKGLSASAAAAIVGNLWEESEGVNPGSQERGAASSSPIEGQGFGIAQWTFSDRQQPLVKLAAAENKPVTDLVLQLDYLWMELTHTDPFHVGVSQQAGLSALLKYEGDLYNQTYYFMGDSAAHIVGFENPNPKYAHFEDLRLPLAKKSLSLFGSYQPSNTTPDPALAAFISGTNTRPGDDGSGDTGQADYCGGSTTSCNAVNGTDKIPPTGAGTSENNAATGGITGNPNANANAVVANGPNAVILCAAQKYKGIYYLWGGGHQGWDSFHRGCPDPTHPGENTPHGGFADSTNGGLRGNGSPCATDCSGLVGVTIAETLNPNYPIEAVSAIISDPANWKRIDLTAAQAGDIVTVAAHHVEIVDHYNAADHTMVTFGSHATGEKTGPLTKDVSSYTAAWRYVGKGTKATN